MLPTNLSASIGLAQLKKLQDNILTRQRNFKRQCDFFSSYNEIFINPQETNLSNTAWLAFPILINEKANFSRKEFQIYLEERNIQTRVVFTGNITRQPMSKEFPYKKNRDFVNADNVMKNGVLLPVHHGLTEEMFTRLHNTIDEFINTR